MKLDLQKFYKACNPAKTIIVGNTEDRAYYIDFSSVRGGKIIEELERTITRLAPDERTCQLFTGHIGCGKSTELLRLKYELELQGFHVVYFESSQDMDMADVDVTDILLAIAHQVSESLEKIKIHLQPQGFKGLIKSVSERLQVYDLEGEFSLSFGIAKITAKAKDSTDTRGLLRQYLEPRTNGIIEAINHEILEPAIAKLKQQDKKGLVVIVDNLDRIHPSKNLAGRSQSEYLFVDRGEQLNQLNCHVVYTIPLELIFSNDLGRLNTRFGGVNPKVLPMVPVRHLVGEIYEPGMKLLRQMVLARAFTTINTEQRLQLITEVFDAPETLDRLCLISGGHVRNLLGLLYRCLQREDPPLSRDTLEMVIKQDCNDLNRGITAEQWESLRQVTKTKDVRGSLGYETLLRSMFVFEYRDRDNSWFDINPILTEAQEYQNHA